MLLYKITNSVHSVNRYKYVTSFCDVCIDDVLSSLFTFTYFTFDCNKNSLLFESVRVRKDASKHREGASHSILGRPDR